MEPSSDNLEQLAGNVQAISKASAVRWRLSRRPSDSAGGWKIQVIRLAGRFSEFYKDNDEWQEITDPAKMGLFVPAAKNSLEELDARSSRINPLNVRSFSIGSVFDRTPAVYLPNFLSFTLVTLIATVPQLLFLNPGDSESGEPYLGSSPFTVLGAYSFGSC